MTATNGTAPYTYLWSNGSTDRTVSGLSSGIYGITVTDNNGCTATSSATILEPTSAISSSISSSTNPSCEGGTTGSATVLATGGTGTPTYLWSNGSTSSTATGLSAGTYMLTVTDGNGCTSTSSVLLTDPTGVEATITSSTNVNCHGGTSGSATVSGTGGAGSYTYHWSNSQTTSTALKAQWQGSDYK